MVSSDEFNEVRAALQYNREVLAEEALNRIEAENERLRAELKGATDFAHDKWTRLRRVEEAAKAVVAVNDGDHSGFDHGYDEPVDALRAALEEE